MVAVLDESVPEWILGDNSGFLRLSVLPKQEINRLLQQSFRCHLPDDPAQQSRWGQDAHLRSVCVQKTYCYWTIDLVSDRWCGGGAYVCISCGSITVTKKRSLTALAKTAAAAWKPLENKSVFQSFCCAFLMRKCVTIRQNRSRTLWASLMSWSQ